MEIVVSVVGFVVLAVAILVAKSSSLRSVASQIDPVSREIERVDRSVREDFATNRREAAESFRQLGHSLVQSQWALGEAQAKQLETFAAQLANHTRSASEDFGQLRREVNEAVQASVAATVSSVSELSRTSIEGLDALSSTVTERIGALETRTADDMGALRRDSRAAADNLRDTVTTNLANSARDQRAALEALREGLDAKVEGLRVAVEQRLRDIQQDNAAKFEQMRQTVDEKLQSTLETRLGESFKQVSERLEQVYKGLGEMQVLATGVGDLKRVLTNVKARGTWGEVQLSALLEQVLSPDQYAPNVATGDGAERVEFAIKLPGRAGKENEMVWLPIDAKFPLEDYQALIEASDRADAPALEEAGRRLEARVKASAKDVASKYVNPPKTTDFAILFLPNEGLYAEVMRRPGLVELLQQQHRIVLAGPTTLWAILTSLQMGFKTLAIERRSSEVWALLGAVKTEFGKFGHVLERVQKNLQSASNKIDEARRGTRSIERKLADVQELPAADATTLLEGSLIELDLQPSLELVNR